jgi:hypothetical protein
VEDAWKILVGKLIVQKELMLNSKSEKGPETMVKGPFMHKRSN